MDDITTTRLESNSKSVMLQKLAFHFDSAPFCFTVERLFNLSDTQIHFVKWR